MSAKHYDPSWRWFDKWVVAPVIVLLLLFVVFGGG
jgi:hypothetical protein